MHYGNQGVCDDSGVNLDANSVFGVFPALLNLQVLLQPFEEHFNGPAVLVK